MAGEGACVCVFKLRIFTAFQPAAGLASPLPPATVVNTFTNLEGKKKKYLLQDYWIEFLMQPLIYRATSSVKNVFSYTPENNERQ